MTAQHSPTPWKIIEAGNGLGIIQKKRPSGVAARDVEDIAAIDIDSEQHNGRANGDFIVLSVNAHDELMAACEAARVRLERALMSADTDKNDEYTHPMDIGFAEVAMQLRAAIAKARGEMT